MKKLFNYLREKYYQWRRYYKNELYYTKQGIWLDIKWYEEHKSGLWYGSIVTYLEEKRAGRLMTKALQHSMDKILWGKGNVKTND